VGCGAGESRPRCFSGPSPNLARYSNHGAASTSEDNQLSNHHAAPISEHARLSDHHAAPSSGLDASVFVPFASSLGAYGSFPAAVRSEAHHEGGVSRELGTGCSVRIA
jgi:hypothetical protein